MFKVLLISVLLVAPSLVACSGGVKGYAPAREETKGGRLSQQQLLAEAPEPQQAEQTRAEEAPAKGAARAEEAKGGQQLRVEQQELQQPVEVAREELTQQQEEHSQQHLAEEPAPLAKGQSAAPALKAPKLPKQEPIPYAFQQQQQQEVEEAPIALAPTKGAAPAKGYAYEKEAPRAEAEPYSFSYQHEGQSRSESGDTQGVVRGQYSLQGADGATRLVDYVADHNGFRASISTNEFGTEQRSPAHVALRSSQPSAEDITLRLEGKTKEAERQQHLESAPVKSAPLIGVASAPIVLDAPRRHYDSAEPLEGQPRRLAESRPALVAPHRVPSRPVPAPVPVAQVGPASPIRRAPVAYARAPAVPARSPVPVAPARSVYRERAPLRPVAEQRLPSGPVGHARGLSYSALDDDSIDASESA